MVKKLNISGEQLFPFQFQVIGWTLLIAGGLFFFKSLIAPIFIVIWLFIVSARNGTEIDIEKKKYRCYQSFFGLRFGKWHTYREVEKIYLKTARVSQKIYTARTLNSITAKTTSLMLFIKFNNDKKVKVADSRNDEKVREKAERISKAFNIEVLDYTDR